jgi:hypothetical protein
VPEHRHAPTSFWRGKHGGLQQKRCPSRALAFSHWDGFGYCGSLLLYMVESVTVDANALWRRLSYDLEVALWLLKSRMHVCSFLQGLVLRDMPAAEGSEQSTHVRRKRCQFWPNPTILHGMHAPDDATHAAT